MKIDYLINELIKEDNKLSNIKIPESLEEKKDLYRALRNIRAPKAYLMNMNLKRFKSPISTVFVYGFIDD